MDEKMDNNAVEAEKELLMRFPDVENGPGSPNLLIPRTEVNFVSVISHRILLVLRDAIRATTRLPKPGEVKVIRKRGLWVRVFGFTTSKNDPLRETAWLDGLRGVAALLVMIYHYHLEMFGFSTDAPYGAKETQPWELWRLPYLRIIWCSGPTQVGLFFVLSGFVLSWSSLASIREGSHERISLSLSSSLFRRWMRLYLPCFLIGTPPLVLFYTDVLDLNITKQSTFLAQVVDYIKESQRFSDPFQLERKGFEGFHAYNASMWTMTHEWAGSLAVYLLMMMVSRIRNYTKRTFILVLIPTYCLLSAKWSYWLFTMGSLMADYVQEAGGFEQLSDQMSRRSRIFWIIILIFGGWLGGIPQKFEWSDRPTYEWTHAFIPSNWFVVDDGARYFWSWSAIITLGGFAHFAAVRRFFERPACRYLGRISFMLYLTHTLIGTIVGGWLLGKLIHTLGTPIPDPKTPKVVTFEIRGTTLNILAYVMTWACLLPLTLAVANWATVLVDEPSVRFAKWIDDKLAGGGDLKQSRIA